MDMTYIQIYDSIISSNVMLVMPDYVSTNLITKTISLESIVLDYERL